MYWMELFVCFHKYQKSNNSHQNNDFPQIIPYLVPNKHIPPQIPASEECLNLLLSNGRGDIFLVCWPDIFCLLWLNHIHEHTNPFTFNHFLKNYTLTCIYFLLQRFQSCTEVLVKLKIDKTLRSNAIFN